MEEFGLVRDFAIIMAVAGGALVLFRQFRLPPILGYLLAGFLVGPFTAGLTVGNLETIRLLADLGLILLLFGIGLEFGWRRIREVGLRVLIIGAVEIAFMIALGYEVAILMGWSGTEGIFLGAAMAISSSAALVKVLRDDDKLHEGYGRLIVGILVVEDFAAVILLSVLSGIASTGAASLGDIGSLTWKLAVFSASAIFLGALIAPKLVRFVARFQSKEILLIASLAMCFVLALIAQELGISAAAGAFLIGVVLGDTDHSGEVSHIMTPIRDMFGALFFVSMGMLVDPHLVARFIGPALIVSAVFIAGKVIANTVGTFIVGHDTRTSIKVGMGMPQIGEFSLAMAKVGADRAVVGPFLYPIVSAATATTSLLYPFLFRSADAVSAFLERSLPRPARRYIANLSSWLRSLRVAISFKDELALQIRHSVRAILLNLVLVLVIITVGTFVVRFTSDLADLARLPRDIVGLLIGCVVVALCIPPALLLWVSLRALTDSVVQYILMRRGRPSPVWRGENLRITLRYSILGLITVLVAVWSLPFISQLIFLGRLSTPLPIFLVVVLIALMSRSAFKIYDSLVQSFRQASANVPGKDAENGSEK